MDDRGLLVAIHAGQLRHRRMQAEESIEHGSRFRPARGERDRAVQAGVIGIADRRHGGEAIETASQHDRKEARMDFAGSILENV
jgi:hypothetical protein